MERWIEVSQFILSGNFLDKHTMGELERRIWDTCEKKQDILEENFTIKGDHCISQGSMNNSGLRLRIVIERFCDPTKDNIRPERS